MRAFIYTRSAEPNPEQQRRQYEQCKTLAEEHQHEVVGIAHDDGYERSGLATLIEGLRAHDIDIVLTSDHACLSPTLTALAAMVDEIHRTGAHLLTCAEPPIPPTVVDMLLKFREGRSNGELGA